MLKTDTFEVKGLIGEVTEEVYHGVIKVKTTFSARELLGLAERERILLGVSPQTATLEDRARARQVAFLEIAVIDAPDWLKNPQEIVDQNIIGEIHDQAVAKNLSHRAELRKQGERALAWLKANAEQNALAAKTLAEVAGQKPEDAVKTINRAMGLV